MNIAYITYARIPTEKAHGLQIVTMCEAFARLGHMVSLVVPRRANPITETAHEYYGTDRFRVQYVGRLDPIRVDHIFGPLAYYLGEWLFAFRALFYSPPKDTLVISRTPLIAWLFHKRGYRTICEVHFWTEGFIARRLLRLLWNIDSIVCNSPGTAAEFTDRGFTNVSYAHNGVTVEDFTVDVDISAVRQNLGVAEGEKVVMYVGALEAWKGVSTLLAASGKLPSNMRVVIIGGTPDHVLALQEDYPEVIFAGARPYNELPANQKAADILVVPNSPDSVESQKYTSPIKLFAHLLSGVPILVSDLPSLRAVADDTMINFFTAGDSADLATEIQTILADSAPYQAKAAAAAEYGTQFDWKNRALNILEKVS